MISNTDFIIILLDSTSCNLISSITYVIFSINGKISLFAWHFYFYGSENIHSHYSFLDLFPSQNGVVITYNEMLNRCTTVNQLEKKTCINLIDNIFRTIHSTLQNCLHLQKLSFGYILMSFMKTFSAI